MEGDVMLNGLKTMAGFTRKFFRNSWFLIPVLLITLFSASPATSSFAATGVIAIAAGANHSVALQSDGSVTAWGNNDFAQTSVPEGLSDVAAIAAGATHTMALKNNGLITAWGNNNSGQATVPEGLSNVRAIAAGGDHS